MYYTRTKLGKINPETFLRNAKQEFPCQSLENTTTWKIKSSTSSFDLCAPTKFVQIAVLVVSKMKQKSSMTDGVHQNGATGKNVKRYQPVKNACHEIQVVKAFHLKFKARLLDYSCSENFCRGI